MAKSLEKLENVVQIYHLHAEHFYMVKRLRKSVQYVRRYLIKCASFLSVSYLTFTNKPCQLWSYWTEFDEILTRFGGVIYAVDAYIEIAIAHSVSGTRRQWPRLRRDETARLTDFVETRPRRDVGTSRERLETETSRPRPQWESERYVQWVILPHLHHPLRYRKKRSRSIMCTQNAFIRWKECENQSNTSGDIW